MTYTYQNEVYEIDDGLEMQIHSEDDIVTSMKIFEDDEVVFATPWFENRWINIENRAETVDMIEEDLAICGIADIGEYTHKLRRILNQIAIDYITEPPIDERLSSDAKRILKRTKGVKTYKSEGEEREWLVTLEAPDDTRVDKPHTFVFKTKKLMEGFKYMNFDEEHISAFITSIEISAKTWKQIQESWMRMADPITEDRIRMVKEKVRENPRMSKVN